MPVPKRKTPRSRSRSRRSQWKATASTFSACQQCRKPKLPHVVCKECGYYAGREVIEVE